VAWETFRVRLLTEFVRNVGLQAGLLFLALASLEAAVPYALSLARREGRARFGRGAAVAAVTALAILTIASVVRDWLDVLFPRAAQVSLVVPGAIATPWPSLIDGSQAIVAALIVSGAVALYPLALRRYTGLVTIAAVFCAVVNPAVTASEAPAMLARAAVLAVLVWAVARYVLDANPLAWPLFIFIALTVQTAAVLVSNQRTDLIAHGVALLVFAAAAIVWSGASWPSPSPPAVSAGPSTSFPPTGERADASPTSPPTSARSE
jgi:hypothetical protein